MLLYQPVLQGSRFHFIIVLDKKTSWGCVGLTDWNCSTAPVGAELPAQRVPLCACCVELPERDGAFWALGILKEASLASVPLRIYRCERSSPS